MAVLLCWRKKKVVQGPKAGKLYVLDLHLKNDPATGEMITRGIFARCLFP